MNGFICSGRIYEYKGWTFEFPAWGGPWPIKQDGTPHKRAGKKFYDLFEEWEKLEDREKYRVAGGCIEF